MTDDHRDRRSPHHKDVGLLIYEPIPTCPVHGIGLPCVVCDPSAKRPEPTDEELQADEEFAKLAETVDEDEEEE